jgi:hypothetical protein
MKVKGVGVAGPRDAEGTASPVAPTSGEELVVMTDSLVATNCPFTSRRQPF